jgi:predicted permease
MQSMTKREDCSWWFESVWRDTRYSLRILQHSAVFGAAIVISLALAIGATTAIFGLINALLLKRLPVYKPDNLVELARTDDANAYTYPLWLQIEAQQNVLSSVFAYTLTTFEVSDRGERRVLPGVLVTDQYFETLGVSMLLGRSLVASDNRPEAPLTCVISYGEWETEFGHAPDVVHRTIRINGRQVQIVGVGPAYFSGIDVGKKFDIIMPLASERALYPHAAALDSPTTWSLSVVGRLRSDIDIKHANMQLRMVAPSIFRNAWSPSVNAAEWRNLSRLSLKIRPIPTGISDMRDRYHKVLLLLMALAAIVLVCACVNVANLLLARSTSRVREIATRVALGASRSQIVRQLLIEALLLGTISATVGTVLAEAADKMIIASISTARDPYFLPVSVDFRLLAFVAIISLCSTLVFGLAPAIRAARVAPFEAIKAGSTASKPYRHSFGRALVLCQITLSMILLISAGLFLKTLHSLLAEDLGYNPDNVLVMETSIPTEEEGFIGLQPVSRDDILAKVRSTEGVTSAARWAHTSTVAGQGDEDILVGDATAQNPPTEYHPIIVAVTPKFFQTLGTPIMAGREFNDTDGQAAPPVAILNEMAARLLFPSRNPVGLQYRQAGSGNSVEIVGLVRSAKYGRPSDDPLPIVYRPTMQTANDRGMFFIRYTGSRTGVSRRLRDTLTEGNSQLAVQLHPLSDDSDEMLTRERLTAIVATVLGLLTLLVAATGIYGITSYSTARRTKEFGVRVAIGASRIALIIMVLAESLADAAIGMTLGIPFAYVIFLIERDMLFRVGPGDLGTVIGSSFIVLCMTIVAAFFPAYKASRVDPLTALKSE